MWRRRANGRSVDTSKEGEAGMKYLCFIWAEGMPAPEDLAVIQRELPGWDKEMTGRGVRLLGRELDLPQTAATVRVRDGEVLVTDGPFAETKEFIAGFNLLECADHDEAVEVAARCPISWFQTLEIRPFTGGRRLGEQAAAFGRGEDRAAAPYLLATWMGRAAAAPLDDQAVLAESDVWQQDLETRGIFVLGNALQGPEAATTVRVRGGKTLLDAGPVTTATGCIAGIDVVSCADRQQAIQLAATHPIARYHAIEVRPFYQE
jgi:hypothetical protein